LLTESLDVDVGVTEKYVYMDDTTEYKEIDWLKTNALLDTRKEVETERKFSDGSLDG